MKERPILFNGDMVRAILGGSKTQTRRLIKPQPSGIVSSIGVLNCVGHSIDGKYGAGFRRDDGFGEFYQCPFGQPGDRLWVRETWIPSLHSDGYNQDGSENVHDCAGYKADMKYRCGKPINKVTGWTPSIHMPRLASRVTLEVVSVRVERLQDISEKDARAEGVSHSLGFASGRTARGNFEHLWWTIYGDGSWEKNPWVWVVEFKRI